MGDLVDLWRDHSPAFGENGTFSGELYAAEAVRVIVDHSTTYPDQPLFMYLAWNVVHAPCEAPQHCIDQNRRGHGDRP